MKCEAALAILSCVTWSLSGCGGAGAPTTTAAATTKEQITDGSATTSITDGSATTSITSMAPVSTTTGATADDLSKRLLEELNKAKDTTINPAIATGIPDPLEMDQQQVVDVHDVCFIKAPGGSACMCEGNLNSTLRLKSIEGLSKLSLTEFTKASVSADVTTCLFQGCTVKIEGDFKDEGVAVNGDVEAKAHYCGSDSTGAGSAATHADLKGHFTIWADGTANVQEMCVNLNITKVNISFNEVSIHDTSVTIDDGPFAGLDLPFLDDMISDSKAQALLNDGAAQISNVLPTVSDKLPCIKISPNVEVV